jgi:hypothetical protein
MPAIAHAQVASLRGRRRAVLSLICRAARSARASSSVRCKCRTRSPGCASRRSDGAADGAAAAWCDRSRAFKNRPILAPRRPSPGHRGGNCLFASLSIATVSTPSPNPANAHFAGLPVLNDMLRGWLETAAFTVDSSHCLKHDSKFPMMIGVLRNRSCDIGKLARRRMASGPGGHQWDEPKLRQWRTAASAKPRGTCSSGSA